VRAQAELEYGDVAVHSAPMRLPITAHVRARPGGPTGLVVTEVNVAITFSYHDFVDVTRTTPHALR
jgi:hypothetical protein